MTHPVSLTELFEAVVLAGRHVREGFGQKTFVQKQDGTPVTKTDMAVHCELMQWAAEHHLGFISEEGDAFSSEHTYVLYVDPLDGTNAFIHGSKEVTIVATLMERALDSVWWKPVMSIIHEPLHNFTSVAEDNGTGWIFEGVKPSFRMHTPGITPVFTPWRVVAFAWQEAPHQMEQARMALEFDSSMRHAPMGSTAFAGGLIASGDVNAVLYPGPSAVETVAMSLIVRSAGGIATDLFGKRLDSYELVCHEGKYDFLLPHGSIMSSNQELLDHLVEVVKSVQ